MRHPVEAGRQSRCGATWDFARKADGRATTCQWLAVRRTAPAPRRLTALCPSRLTMGDVDVRFWEAAAGGDLLGVLTMANSGANINTLLHGVTALHKAAAAGFVDVVQGLLEAGADPNIVDEDCHETPLHWAASDTKDQTATQRGMCIQALLRSGADPTMKNEEGLTALECCDDPVLQGIFRTWDEVQKQQQAMSYELELAKHQAREQAAEDMLAEYEAHVAHGGQRDDKGKGKAKGKRRVDFSETATPQEIQLETLQRQLNSLGEEHEIITTRLQTAEEKSAVFEKRWKMQIEQATAITRELDQARQELQSMTQKATELEESNAALRQEVEQERGRASRAEAALKQQREALALANQLAHEQKQHLQDAERELGLAQLRVGQLERQLEETHTRNAAVQPAEDAKQTTPAPAPAGNDQPAKPSHSVPVLAAGPMRILQSYTPASASLSHSYRPVLQSQPAPVPMWAAPRQSLSILQPFLPPHLYGETGQNQSQTTRAASGTVLPFFGFPSRTASLPWFR
eukprot:TRINITY_DN328_c0_g1_i1.p1 TRINITY_DN328_c0_g1~~TRINITY_DN328_c0_g1_i1.p1  ORF type:complete len:518 (+),score=120.72 TRINITY_DN328_c0_g1_i1:497-2050(+)